MLWNIGGESLKSQSGDDANFYKYKKTCSHLDQQHDSHPTPTQKFDKYLQPDTFSLQKVSKTAHTNEYTVRVLTVL